MICLLDKVYYLLPYAIYIYFKMHKKKKKIPPKKKSFVKNNETYMEDGRYRYTKAETGSLQPYNFIYRSVAVEPVPSSGTIPCTKKC